MLDLAEPSEAQRDAAAAADGAEFDAGDYLARARRAAQAQITENPASSAQSLGVRGRLVALGAAGTIAVLVSAGYQTLSDSGGALQPRGAQAETVAVQDPRVQYERAVRLIGDQRTGEAIALLQRAADAGFALAQYRLAKLYERGEGVDVDLSLARFWTERAAAAGNRRAMHDLGVFFARGEGAPLDEAAAFRWFRQAAELGVADSQFNLGVLYEQGRGVAPSATEALFWFLVAAGQGDRDASARAASVQAQLSPAEVEQAQGRALAFRPRVADAIANGELDTRDPAGRSET
jgi:localization factor PodJL